MLGLEEAVHFSIKVTIALCCALFYLSYKFVTKHSDYWHKQGVNFIKPVPIFGSVASNFLLKEHVSESSQRWYKENAGQPFIGYFRGRSPTLMIFDPELIKQIFIKDFSHFSDRGFQVARRLKIRTMDEEVKNFFLNLTKDMIQHRKKNSIVRNDFLQLLMELKDKGRVAIANDDEDATLENEDLHESNTPFRFDDTDLAAQATIFFLAGFETSSSAVSFALLELAVNPDIQRKAHSEIDEQLAKCGGEITYETLKEMKYLEWIADETLRKYPAVAVHFRMCNKKYTLPGRNITLEKGMHVAIPNYALQNDPKYFANPERFDPERFSSDDILNKLQYIYTPFGLGPRQCIGNRFAMVQTKLALLTFLQKYTVSTCEKTHFPVKFEAKQFIPTAKDGIWLQIKNRG
ncbi:Hypothetical predicted protein [Cloeon dipterum]|uniref:Cytochrome P450 n=1 Tax=Cloeon dipterum TaxID=197152 RepID=A0A8S1CCY2_9INSE|nr:Hypothetical predicted protein [Cloeon dipterum]